MSTLIEPHRRATPAPAAVAVHPHAPRNPAARVALAYLALSFPLLFLNGLAATPWPMVAGHLVASAGLFWALRSGSGNPLAAWLPILLTPFFYMELPALIAGVNGPGYHDAAVQGWELALFGFQPSHEWAGMMPWVWLSEALHAGYLSYYFMIFGPPLVLFLRGRREEFAGSQLAVLATFVGCYTVFILFPVEGPRYAWPAPPGLPDGPLRSFAKQLLEGGSSRGTAFPSSHAAVAVAATLAALRYQWRVGLLSALFSLLLVLGAVYAGYHYAIDMIVGIALGLAVTLPTLGWFDRTGRGR